MAGKKNRSEREKAPEINQLGGGSPDVKSPKDGFAAADNGSQPELEQAAATDAAEQILGANPLLGLDRDELLDAARRLLKLMTLKPQVLVEENLAFGRELVAIAMGQSK